MDVDDDIDVALAFKHAMFLIVFHQSLLLS